MSRLTPPRYWWDYSTYMTRVEILVEDHEGWLRVVYALPLPKDGFAHRVIRKIEGLIEDLRAGRVTEAELKGR